MAQDACVTLVSRSCRTSFARVPASPRSMGRFPGLLDDPGSDRVLRDARDPDAPAAVLDHRKDVHLRGIEQVSGEEVQRQDPLPWDRRNSAQPGPSRRGAGSIPAPLRICQTVDGAAVMPSVATATPSGGGRCRDATARSWRE